MDSFEYRPKTHLFFGKEKHKLVGELLKSYGYSRILLHYGGGSIKVSGLYDDVVQSLVDSGVEFTELGGVKPNPRMSLVREGIRICRENKLQFVLAVGGGSVIDSAKAICYGLSYEGDVLDLYEGKAVPAAAFPHGNILTIPAAGSETGANSVITDEASQRKLSCKNDINRPLFSIVNPELFYTLPKNQIANGATDIISHMFERYFTQTEGTELMDGLLESAIRTAMECSLKLMEDNKDYNSWAQLSLTGTLAHNDILQLGRETDWATHGMEHELSAFYDIPHGAGLAVLTPAWMEYVWRARPSVFVSFARNIMQIKEDYAQEELIELAIRKLREFYHNLNQPSRIREFDIPQADLKKFAVYATTKPDGTRKTLGNFKKLNEDDVLSIYNSCY